MIRTCQSSVVEFLSPVSFVISILFLRFFTDFRFISYFYLIPYSYFLLYRISLLSVVFASFDNRESSSTPLSIFFSTSSSINDLYSNYLRPIIIRSVEVDDNRDGVMDRLEVGIQVPLGINETVSRMDLLLHHTVTLSNRVKYVFDGVTYVTCDSSNPMGGVQVDGDVLIRQTSTLQSKGG